MNTPAPQHTPDHAELAAGRLDKIRENLLNFSRRNPLVNTRLDGKTSRYLRVVDEMPQVLYDNLTGGQQMEFASLPAIADPPPDEQSERFQAALLEALRSDERYRAEVRELKASEAAGRRTRRDPKRALMDRVRERLDLPKRVNPLNPTAAELRRHARANGVEPDFDLPRPDEAHPDGRHADREIQTLALPEQMRRNLEKVHDDDRTARQEAGINSLYCAFGFLEWSDPGKPDGTCVSPLLLLPVALQFDRKRQRFAVAGTAVQGEPNLVLAEKLRREFRVELSATFEGDIEAYFAKIAASAPQQLNATVHRYVAFGTFNSNQVAVFHDLDPANWTFDGGAALDLLVSSAGTTRAADFSAEYPVDSPEFRSLAPLLIADADSSQVSTIIDIARGKSFALEGPPGSGKSQTIVNTIAAALEQGKKVLFVAQKTAALEVVRARLTERGLSDFLLTLQADRSERQAFREQLRSRIDLAGFRDPQHYSAHLDGFLRQQALLQGYLDTLAEPCGKTSLTVHEVLSEAIATAEVFRLAADDLPRPCFSLGPDFDASAITTVKEAAASFSHALLNADSTSPWAGIAIGPLDRTAADAHLRGSSKAADAYRRAAVEQERLGSFGIGGDYLAENDLDAAADRMRRLAELHGRIDLALVASLLRGGLGQALRELLADCTAAAGERSALAVSVREPASPALEQRLRDCAYAATRLGFGDFDTDQHAAGRQAQADRVDAGRRSIEALDFLRPETPWLDDFQCADLASAAALLDGDCVPFLRLRNQANTAEAGWEHLQSVIDRIEWLRAERDRLTEFFRFDRKIDPETAHTAADVLETTGTIGKLSGTYRSAKKHYRGLALTPKPFESGEASMRLERLAQWQDKVDSLIADHQVTSLFGPGFTGLDTPLDLYKGLVSYLRDVETGFSGIRLRRLRKLLLEGETDQLSTLAKVDLADYRVAVTDLATAVETEQGLLDDMDRLLPELAACAQVLNAPTAATPEDVAALADTVAAMLARLDRIATTSLRPLLGDRIDGADTDTDSFANELDAVAIAESDRALLEPLTAMLLADTLTEAADVLDSYAEAAAAGAAALEALTTDTSVPTEWITAVPDCAARAAHAEALAGDRTGLQSHSMVHHRLTRLHALGFGPVADWLRRRPGMWSNAAGLVLAHLHRGLAEAVFDTHGERLRAYLGTELDDLRDRLAQADARLQNSAASMLGAKLYREAEPPAGVNRGRVSEFSEMGLLAHEMGLQRSRNSVREITRRAAGALLELKPCWMMSPLAVSQYLRRDVHFDLCVIDEASQMLPGAAMGAVLRSKQVMIVGDNNQLPPTDLFTSTAAVEEEDDEDFTEDAESVLEMAGKAFPDSRRLRWHYRSRNSGLIAFSNEMIYENQLVVFPSSWEERAGTGVRLEYLPEGRYEKSLNRVEAESVVNAVARFARTDRDRSLGVVAMNVQQRNLINDLLHERAVQDRALREYQIRWEAERNGIDALFVKNLENVQGDERDVIFISTVYGPKETGGPVHQNFGPVNHKAGRRRLNVLFTRAREQLVTFTSMQPGDITADEHGSPGRYMLRRWLEYCANGGVHAVAAASEKPGSRLAEYIGARLEGLGLDVTYEVGTAGHRIDIAVRHPDWPNGYLCGIDCDGEAYYTSNSARDRDILRQQVLEGLGWSLYRVWSVNWFNDEEAELDRLRTWIEDRLRSAVGAEARPEPVEPCLEPVPEPRPESVAESPAASASTFRFPWDGPEEPPALQEPLHPKAGDVVALELPNGSVIRPRLVRDERAMDDRHRLSITGSPGIFLLDMAVGDERDVRMFGQRTRIKLLRIDRPD